MGKQGSQTKKDQACQEIQEELASRVRGKVKIKVEETGETHKEIEEVPNTRKKAK